MIFAIIIQNWRGGFEFLPAGRQGSKAAIKFMYCVYFLQSLKDKGLYIGKTSNIKRRLAEHNAGKVQSTKSRKPFILLGLEKYQTEKECLAAELKWKKGYKREQLKVRYSL